MKDKLSKRHNIDYLRYIGDMCCQSSGFKKDWEEFYFKYKFTIKAPKDYYKDRFIRSSKRIARWFCQKRGIILLNTPYDLTWLKECDEAWSKL